MAKKAIKDNEVLELPAEEITEELTQEQLVEKFDHAINGTLQKQNITEAVLRTMKEEYSKLTINGIEDKAGYEDTHRARMNCVSLRGKVKKACEKGRENANLESDRWLKKQKEIIARITEIEKPLMEMEEKIDAEKDRIKKESIAKAQKTANDRTIELTKMGAVYTGMDFILDEVVFESNFVCTCDEETYQSKVLPEYRAVWQKKEEERIQKENDRKAEEQRIKQEQDRLKEEQAQLDRDRKAIEDQKKEMARQRYQSRAGSLISLGMITRWDGEAIEYKDTIRVSKADIENMDDDKWNDFLSSTRSRIDIAKEEEKKKRDKEDADRQEQLIKQQQAQKAEELAQASDATKWKALKEYFQNSPQLEFTSKKYQAKYSKVELFLIQISGE